VNFPFNPLIEDDTEIFYMIDEGNVVSVQCNVSLKRAKSMSLGGLSLSIIDFYVPALTPSLNGTETSLQLSENITFVVCFIYRGIISNET
jgi:hypothetical protein